MDALSQLVSLVDPRGRLELRCLFGPAFAAPHVGVGPWRAPFHVVLRGECALWLPATGETHALTAGSLVILPRGAAHTLHAGPARRRAPDVRARPGDLLELKTNLADDAAPDAAAIELLCGEFEFRGRRRSALLEALPEAVAVQFAGRPDFAWLESLVRLMAQEVARPQPGSTALVGELAGALFTLALRAHLAAHPAHDGVLGLMRHDRLAPALKAMLDEPAAPWTVESLADRCHLSRARFARLFAEHAGAAPLAMLTRLRMELAGRLLAQGGLDTAAVGEAVGYQSEAAFNRAFARHAGVPPGRFRRQAQGDAPSA